MIGIVWWLEVFDVICDCGVGGVGGGGYGFGYFWFDDWCC